MVVFEGCSHDDRVILGGRNQFVMHFCTFFPFEDLCFSVGENATEKMTNKVFGTANGSDLDERINKFFTSFDSK